MNSIAYTMLWLFVSVLPWEGVVRVNNTAILSQATGMLAMGCTVFAVIASGRLRRWHTLHVAALLFVLTAAFDLLVFHRLGVRLPAKFIQTTSCSVSSRSRAARKSAATTPAIHKG
jgi:hypothetical protein